MNCAAHTSGSCAERCLRTSASRARSLAFMSRCISRRGLSPARHPQRHDAVRTGGGTRGAPWVAGEACRNSETAKTGAGKEHWTRKMAKHVIKLPGGACRETKTANIGAGK